MYGGTSGELVSIGENKNSIVRLVACDYRYIFFEFFLLPALRRRGSQDLRVVHVDPGTTFGWIAKLNLFFPKRKSKVKEDAWGLSAAARA